MLGVAAAAAVAIPIAALAGPGSPEAPDLRADAPENPFLELYDDSAQHNLGIGDRLLIRFDGFVTNVGDGPLEISGNPQISDPGNDAGTRQRARDSITGNVDHVVGNPEVIYETADGHNHFHLQKVMRYSLWNQDRTAEVAPGQKVGFCLYDSEFAPQPRPPADPFVYTGAVTQFCDQNNPGTTDLVMGTSVGWRDVYDSGLSFQWVDVSNVAPGIYSLASEADPENRIWEGGGSYENNPRAFTPGNVTVPGYVAQPVSAPIDGATTVTLAAQNVGGVSNLRFKITAAPQHGTLNRAVGVEFTDPNVVYTPGGPGKPSDGFSYVAYRSDSQYPLNPPAATASLAGDDVAVAISGVPPRLIATTSAQLAANVTNGPNGVTWAVDGVVGGNATVGTITPQGLYVAPAVPPPGGSVVIRATSVDNPSVFAEAGIGIDPVPEPLPAPSPTETGPPTGTTTTTKALISKPVVYRRGRNLYARVDSGADGKVAIIGKHGRRTVGRCNTNLLNGQRFTCRMRLTKKQARTAHAISVTAIMRADDGRKKGTRTRLTTASKLAGPTARVRGRKITVTSRVSQDGTVKAEIFARGKRVAVCTRFQRAGTRFRCTRTLPKGVTPKQVRVKMTLSKRGSSKVLGRKVLAARR